MAEKLPKIIDTRPPDETCSQYIFGPDRKFIDVEFEAIRSDPRYKNLPATSPLQEGDIIFYATISRDVTHVARVVEDGRIISKFQLDPDVYEHDLWGPPIPPLSPLYEAYIAFRVL